MTVMELKILIDKANPEAEVVLINRDETFLDNGFSVATCYEVRNSLYKDQSGFYIQIEN